MSDNVIRVLSIEDNVADATLIQEMLAEIQRVSWGLPHFEIAHVARLQGALDRLGDGGFDVVLTDLDLPDSQAGETVATLREHIPHMPLVVLTGREDEALARKSVRAGVQDYLYKNEVTGSLLARALMYAIERQQAHAKLEQRVAERTADLQAEIAERVRVEERFGNIYAESPIGIELYDVDGNLVEANDACLNIFGVSDVTAVQGFKLFEDPNLPELAKEGLLQGETVQYETAFDFEHVKRRGLYETARSGTIYLDVKITALGMREIRSPVGYLVQVQDVTERVRAESQRASALEALRASERSLDQMLQTMVEGMVRVNIEGEITYANLAAERILEVRKDVIQGRYYDQRDWQQIDEHGDPFPLEQLPLTLALRQRRQVEGVEHGIRALNGETKWLSVNAAPLLDEHGQLHGAVASFRDVTERKLAEERQGRMAAVVQMSPDAIVIVDVAGKIIYANSAMARMCGLNAQADVIGTNAVDWFASPDEARAISQETLEKGSLGHWECQGLDKQGRRIPVEISTTVMRNNLGEITGFAAIIRDITARKRVENALRESEYKLRSIIERSPSSIVLCDERGVIIKWNAAQERVSGMGQEEALGRLMWDVAFQMAPQERRTPQAFERIRAMMQSLLSDGQAPWPRQAHEQVIQRPDGTRCVVETHVFPVETDKGFMLCSITHDVTARVQTEKKLERYAAELKRSNRDLGQFASVISHDLREPLRMVSSYLELLERRYRAALDEQALAYIAYAADGAGRMHEMIQALLRLAQVETHGGAFTPTDVETTLVRVCQALERAIEEAGAEVTHDALPTVMADEAQLAQILQNLIANGIKFCRADAPPRVHVSARQGDDEWVFSVADNGIGIDPQQGGRIFEIFQRLHTREEYEGAGIGLALCQRIVERHGGRIWVESEPGAGSTFYFTLP